MIKYRFLIFTASIAILSVYIQIDKFDGQSAVVAPLWRILLSIALLICLLWCVDILGEFLERSVGRRWWNIGVSDSASAPSWDSLVHMLCNDKCDPLIFKRSDYRPNRKEKFHIFLSIQNINIILSAVVLGIFCGIMGFFIMESLFPNMFLVGNGVKDTSINGNIAAYIALVGTALTIIFTYKQFRAKVRADSRQAWVNKVRELISDVLVNVNEVIENGREAKNFSEFNKARTHLELHLNPSEADHRLLMFFIRSCAFPDLLIGNDRIVLDEMVNILQTVGPKIRELSNSVATLRNIDALENLVFACSKQSPNSKVLRKAALSEHKDEIVSFIFRVSHNILKREWERVRHAK